MPEPQATETTTTTTTPATPAGGQPAGETQTPATGQGQPAAPTTFLGKPEGGEATPGTKEGEGQTGEAAKPTGAPEKYEFKALEGQTLDAAAVGQFEPIARELNLSQDQAQKLVDLYGSQIAAMNKAHNEAFVQTQNDWQNAIKTDKEMGGTNLEASMTVANKALDRFGSPALSSYLAKSGLGNHPEIARVFFKVGKAMAEDTHETGPVVPEKALSLAERLYPTSAQPTK